MDGIRILQLKLSSKTIYRDIVFSLLFLLFGVISISNGLYLLKGIIMRKDLLENVSGLLLRFPFIISGCLLIAAAYILIRRRTLIKPVSFVFLLFGLPLLIYGLFILVFSMSNLVGENQLKEKIGLKW